MTLPRLRAPIILVHGLFGFDRLPLGPWGGIEYFHALPDALTESGNVVVRARLSPMGGIALRASQLQQSIEQLSSTESVHILAHSMGGLDARYMIVHLGMSPRVLSLTTLGTPHRGSPFANWAARRVVPLVAPVIDQFGLAREGLTDLTLESCRTFNERTPNAPAVRYFSVAGQIPHSLSPGNWTLSESVIYRAEGPNDGLVSVASARWGETHEVWDGDHMSLVNWTAFAPGRLSDRMPLYGRLFGRLSDEGF